MNEWVEYSDMNSVPASTDGLDGDDEPTHHDVLPACDEAAQPLRLRV